MRTQKNIGIALALLGFFSMVILLALNIAGGSMERDSALLCGSCLAVCGAGFALAVGGERELPFVPHSLFPVLCTAAAILVHELDELFMPLLLLVLLGCASVCIYGRERAHIIFSAVYVGLGGAGALLTAKLSDLEFYIVYVIAGAVPLANYLWVFIKRIRTEKTEKTMRAWQESCEQKYEDCDLLEALLKRIADESEKSYQKIRVIELFTDRMIITALTRGQDTVQTAVFSDLECSVEELPDIMNVRAFANVMQRRLGAKYCVARQQNPNSARIVIAV
ncbi:MAG TPA: hypothetical protein DCP68_00385 [Ruminococcus sp.]|nr:hypothetical protein [Ruminococcus sp.]